MQLWKTHKIQILLVLTSIAFYISFAFDLQRADFIKLISLYAGLFFVSYKLVQLTKHDFKFLVWMSFLFRAVFILAIPNLSQDFYRFIWDGRMILEGFNPYLFTPDHFIAKGELPIAQAEELYNGMGSLSAGHYTNYPPINQLCFVIAGLFAGKSILGSVVVLRLIIIAADFGALYFGKKLLEKLMLPTHNIFWYILNPFIIIELTGNLHFEGVMVFFLVWSLYLLYQGKWQWAAVVFALSVSIKLIPLLFLPLFWQWFVNSNVIANKVKQSVPKGEIATSKDAKGQYPRHEKRISYAEPKGLSAFAGMTRLLLFYLIVGSIILLTFIPFYDPQFISNYTQTVALWFQNFEFNASLYYVAREIGYRFRGYNEIAIIGKIIPVAVLFFVLLLTFFNKNKTMIQLVASMLLALSFYYFTATTVHPWYIATLLLLSLFTKYRFPLVWSFAIVLSYSAYTVDGFNENLWIVTLEYLIVYGVLIYELWFKTDELLEKQLGNEHINHLNQD